MAAVYHRGILSQGWSLRVASFTPTQHHFPKSSHLMASKLGVMWENIYLYLENIYHMLQETALDVPFWFPKVRLGWHSNCFYLL
jgi:hypothetical protein